MKGLVRKAITVVFISSIAFVLKKMVQMSQHEKKLVTFDELSSKKDDSIANEVQEAIKDGATKNNDLELTARQEKLIELFEKKEELGMSDISQEFEGVTDRTLRRDLNSLIDKKLVAKEGSTKNVVYRKL